MQSLKILVIDDEPDICELIQACLEEFAGWEVTTANTAQEGISLAKNILYDVILLDISMPVVDGLLVFKQLQEIENTKDVKVIFITAKVLPSDRRRFSEMGVKGVISKPFNPVTLWQEISRILERDE